MARPYPYNLIHAMKLIKNTQNHEILIRLLNYSKGNHDDLLKSYTDKKLK